MFEQVCRLDWKRTKIVRTADTKIFIAKVAFNELSFVVAATPRSPRPIIILQFASLFTERPQMAAFSCMTT